MQSRYYNPDLGRFLNVDNYLATGQGLLGNNAFAYCLNNPIVYRDSAGTEVVAITAGSVAACVETVLIAAAIIFVIALVVDPNLRSAIADAASDTVAVVGTWIDDQKKLIEERLIVGLRRNSKSDDSTHVHHIVAQNSPKAAPARYIINMLFDGGVNNALNLISVKASVHRRLHTTIYYNSINYTIMQAYLSAGPDKTQQIINVSNTLMYWQMFISTLNELSP